MSSELPGTNPIGTQQQHFSRSIESMRVVISNGKAKVERLVKVKMIS